jgi:hypothetical protein
VGAPRTDTRPVGVCWCWLERADIGVGTPRTDTSPPDGVCAPTGVCIDLRVDNGCLPTDRPVMGSTATSTSSIASLSSMLFSSDVLTCKSLRLVLLADVFGFGGTTFLGVALALGVRLNRGDCAASVCCPDVVRERADISGSPSSLNGLTFPTSSKLFVGVVALAYILSSLSSSSGKKNRRVAGLFCWCCSWCGVCPRRVCPRGVCP